MKLLLLLLLLFLKNTVFASINVEFLLKFFKRQAEDIKNTIGSETECFKQIQIFQSDLEKLEVWSIALLDATGKLESGLMQGTVVNFGSFDECIGINKYVNGSHLQGKFCTAQLTPTENALQCVLSDENLDYVNKDISEVINTVHVKWGICALAACSESELQTLWDFIEYRYQMKFHLTFKEDSCFTKDKVTDYPTLSLVVWFIFFLIGVIILVSTIYDIFVFQKYKEKEYNIWMAFSFYTNSKRLLSTKETDSSTITCIYGLRVITMAWIVLGHTYFAHIQLFAANNVYLLEWLKDDWSMFILGALAGVDTYLVISGFLIVYVTEVARAQETPIHLFVFFGHRVMRLSPAFAAIILLYVGVLTHLGSGPLWSEVDRLFKQPCIEHWWASIFYFQNYYKATAQCATHGWYLAVDTQLYMLSPIILILLIKRPKIGIFVIVILICACIALNIKTTYDYNLDSLTIQNLISFFAMMYLPTHLRAVPLFVGIILGYIIIKYKDKEVYINKIIVVICWVLTIVTMVCICYSFIYATKYGITLVSMALYNGLSHLLWAICISWVIFACTKGYGGFINTMLSIPLFRVFSRITYGLYLLHVPVIWCLLFQQRTHTYASNVTQFHQFWGNYMFSSSLAFVWTLMFESPVAMLESVAKEKANVWIQKLTPRLLLK